MASPDEEEQTKTTRYQRLRGLLPILKWTRTYDRRWLTADLIAGITVL